MEPKTVREWIAEFLSGKPHGAKSIEVACFLAEKFGEYLVSDYKTEDLHGRLEESWVCQYLKEMIEKGEVYITYLIHLQTKEPTDTLYNLKE